MDLSSLNVNLTVPYPTPEATYNRRQWAGLRHGRSSKNASKLHSSLLELSRVPMILEDPKNITELFQQVFDLTPQLSVRLRSPDPTLKHTGAALDQSEVCLWCIHYQSVHHLTDCAAKFSRKRFAETRRSIIKPRGHMEETVTRFPVSYQSQLSKAS